jgi:transposase
MNNYQLSSKELRVLEIAHKGVREKRKADRIKAVYLLGKGWSVSKVHEALMIDESTIRNYHARFKDGDLMGLLDDQYVNNKGLLGENELSYLESHLEDVVYRTGKDVIAFIEEEFDVTYSLSGVHDLLKRLGFVYKKPERTPAKADLVSQEKFIRRYRKISREVGAEDHLCFMDTTHPQHETHVGYGWIKRGKKAFLPSTAKQPRLNIQGIVDIKRLDIISHMSRAMITKESVKDMLAKLRRHKPSGWIYLICDRAAYYDNEEVRAYANSMAIKLIYLPAYSPNLNLIERVWLYFKKMTLHNRYYGSFAQFEAGCRQFFRQLRYQKANLQTLLTENFQRLHAF